MKILEHNGYKYSRKPFEGHTHRAKIRFSVSKDWREDVCVDIYTNNSDREEVNNTIVGRTTEKVIECKLEYWTTKEQDDSSSKFIDEWLNEEI